VYVFAIRRGYRASYPVTGFARLNARAPTAEVSATVSERPYCLPFPTFNGTSTIIDPVEYPYYASDSGVDLPHNKLGYDFPSFEVPRHPCIYLDA